MWVRERATVGTPLPRAAENGYAMVVQLLLGHGRVDLNSRDAIYGRTPLSWAAGGGHKTVVRLLLGQQDVESNAKDTDYDRAPLWWVRRSEN
jgi:ankyrin repeat protein